MVKTIVKGVCIDLETVFNTQLLGSYSKTLKVRIHSLGEVMQFGKGDQKELVAMSPFLKEID